MGLLVSLHSGPGTGKSTRRAGVFAELKMRGHNVEENPEVAKWLTWDERHGALGFQPYIFGKQAYREQRLLDQVEAVITDTSVLYSLIYVPSPKPPWYAAFTDFVVDYYQSLNTLDVFLRRDPKRVYNPRGRNQSQAEAEALDEQILDLLTVNGIPFLEVQVDTETHSDVKMIADLVEDRLYAYETEGHQRYI